jgi:hypothetical protein
MTVRRDVALQLALVKEMIDEKAQKLELEERIKAAERRSTLLLENAARKEIETYKQTRMDATAKARIESHCAFQLSLGLDETALSAPPRLHGSS